VQWIRQSEREAKRIDRALDRAEAAERNTRTGEQGAGVRPQAHGD
jgi:putative copper resistance protein D